MTYRAVGSSTGQFEFLGENNPAGAYTSYNDFGAGDIPMKASNYALLQANRPGMVHIPFAVGGIGIFHSVPASNLPTRGKIDLDACLLARIFSRNIKTWDHPAILAKNPGMTVPPQTDIRVVHRVKGSSSTSGTTEYLNQTCPQYWSGIGMGVGSTITWGADTVEGQGSGGVTDQLKTIPYAISYLDAGHGHEAGFGEVELMNKDGFYVTAQDADIGAAASAALANGVLPAVPTADFSAVNLYDQSGALTFPITMMSYIYVQSDLRAMNPDTAALLKAFLEYLNTPDVGFGQDVLAAYKFVKIPTEVIQYNTNTINTVIQWPAGMQPFIFETKETTQKGTGAGDRVISGKRQCIGAYERNSLLTPDVAALKTQEAATQASLATLQTKTGHMPAVSDGKVSMSLTDPDNAMPAAVTGVIISVLAFLIAVAAACKAFAGKGGAKTSGAGYA